ncbi:DUF6798 domain-containing protein [Allorhodopirellula solitaria]|uniref:DUF6798 domain-containing protein n=1 Tax=Allorhodopirellula solitaria TaxID=2527987 RepID=UPI003704CCEA
MVGLCFVYAGDAPPGVNEAHYLAKAKNFWNPAWCSEDLFVASGKAHALFYWVFGWPTQWCSLSTTAWIGRLIGWGMLAAGLVRLCSALRVPAAFAVIVAIVWIAGIEQGNLAGEWVVGGIEAKVPAYGLVLLGIAELLQRNWNRVWLLFGAAAAFHVLTGGWAVVAAALAFAWTERVRRDPTQEKARFFTPALFAGGAISLIGLVPAMAMSWNASPAESTSAARVYTYFRISHHLLPSAFHRDWYVRHAVLSLITLVCLEIQRRLAKRHDPSSPAQIHALRSLAAFTVGAMCISICGLFVGILPAVAPDLAAKLLRFYWFRLADVTTPLALGCSIAVILSFTHAHYLASRRSIWEQPWASLRVDARGAAFLACLMTVLMAGGLVGLSTWQRVRAGVPISHSNNLLGLRRGANYAEQRQTMQDWINVCRFVRANTPEQEVLLTPRHQQSFKWYAERAEVVNWKDIPQDVATLREWARRFVEIFPFELSTMRVTIRYDRLREFRRKYNVNWIIVDRRVVGPQLPLVQVYPLDDERNATYAVYRLPSER